MRLTESRVTQRFRDRGSKFIGRLFPATNREEFEEELASARAEYPDATHHCYAWRIDPLEVREFSSDDGEPSGTAGPPILSALRSFGLVNAAVVVTRYYGGTNLGKSGLIAAYGHTARLCLEEADCRPVELVRRFRLRYPYSRQNLVDTLQHRYGLRELDAEYREEVSRVLGCPLSGWTELKEELSASRHLGLRFENMGKDYL